MPGEGRRGRDQHRRNKKRASPEIDGRESAENAARAEGTGARRIWSDSKGILWVSEWNAGQLARFDPATGEWREWALPGDDPSAYAVYVDEKDMVWISDFGANAILRFDPATERFESFPIPRGRADVRQMLGRAGEVWTAESGTDRLTVYRHD